MAQHGYLGEYDETSDRGEDRDRWRDEDRQRREPDRDFMFRRSGGEWSPESERYREEDRQYRSTRDDDWRRRDSAEQGRFRGGADRDRSPRRFSSHQDDHYRSWRDKQMQALDRDYEDYCREREQQFHRDFDSWRRDRRSQGSSKEAIAEESELVLTHDRAISGQANTPSPVGQATLGTNNSENTNPGPGKPSV